MLEPDLYRRAAARFMQNAVIFQPSEHTNRRRAARESSEEPRRCRRGEKKRGRCLSGRRRRLFREKQRAADWQGHGTTWMLQQQRDAHRVLAPARSIGSPDAPKKSHVWHGTMGEGATPAPLSWGHPGAVSRTLGDVNATAYGTGESCLVTMHLAQWGGACNF